MLKTKWTLFDGPAWVDRTHVWIEAATSHARRRLDELGIAYAFTMV